MIKITIDKSANLKRLRKFERAGIVEIHAVSIEGFEDSNKVKRQHMPVAVWGSKHGTFDNSVWAADDTPYERIQEVIGKHNHGDCLHLERHISSGRDIFVTDDNDFLSKRLELEREFNIVIRTTDEIEKELGEKQ